MLDAKALEALEGGKNLLAFSGGVDSSALFFLLVEAGVAFDIAIVDYGVRTQSIEEVAYAQSLAKRYAKRCHLYQAPAVERDFEAKARRIRYDFFESLAPQYGYATLITAHQLNDQMEWFLMQFAKGAGSLELVGMQSVQEGAPYRLVRPLLSTPKSALLEYLKSHNIDFFIDSTNSNRSYLRNTFRLDFSDAFVERYASGIAQSFGYITQDNAQLLGEVKVRTIEAMTIVTASHRRALIYSADKVLKTQGMMLSQSQKEWLMVHDGLLVARKIALEIVGNSAYLAPYLRGVVLPKDFKEACRKADIPAHIRPYCYEQKIAISTLLNND